ncbi:MAG: hypothetical protein NC548_62575 [Lachnospiraceae bacterium]|nr:hypothetical protein [Lachnospiraceae bacterium]
MTVQEKALKWIQTRLIEIRSMKQKTRKHTEEMESLTTAKVALQRQSAVSAIYPEKRHDTLACPRCGHYLDGKPFHCQHCGQHIKYGKSDLTEFTTFEDVIPVTVTRDTTDNCDMITIEAANGTEITLELTNIVGDLSRVSCECAVSYRDYR